MKVATKLMASTIFSLMTTNTMMAYSDGMSDKTPPVRSYAQQFVGKGIWSHDGYGFKYNTRVAVEQNQRGITNITRSVQWGDNKAKTFSYSIIPLKSKMTFSGQRYFAIRELSHGKMGKKIGYGNCHLSMLKGQICHVHIEKDDSQIDEYLRMTRNKIVRKGQKKHKASVYRYKDVSYLAP